MEKTLPPLLAALDENSREKLLAASQTRQAAKGEFLMHEGDACIGFYLVKQGSVKLFRTDPKGKEHLVHLILSGRTFAEGVVFLRKPRYPVGAQALEDSELLFFPKDAVLELLSKDPGLSLALLGSLSMWLHTLLDRIYSLESKSLEERLTHLLSMLPGETLKSGERRVTPPCTKAELASLLGVTPEAFSRALARLESQGDLTRDGQSLVLKAQK